MTDTELELDAMVSDLSHTGELSMLYRMKIADAITALRAERAAALAGAVRVKPLVYVASKAKYGHEWLEKRDAGYPIISTWIDQSGVGETSDWPALWTACIAEASQACALVLVCRKDDTLKGAWSEVGAALAHGRRVFAVGIESYSIRHHPNVTLCATEEEAFTRAYAETFQPIRAALEPDPERAAWRDVLAERARQISAEGWTSEHDDAHYLAEMAEAAAVYALLGTGVWSRQEAGYLWPSTWDKGWLKHGSPRRMLVKAGALILAEIERIDRAALKGKTP